MTGVNAEGEDGSTYTVSGRAVVLATGGYGANQVMIAQYSPKYAGHVFNCSPCSTGEGIEMGVAAGGYVE